MECSIFWYQLCVVG